MIEMRSFALILTLGGAGLAHADDIDNWGVRCLNEGYRI